MIPRKRCRGVCCCPMLYMINYLVELSFLLLIVSVQRPQAPFSLWTLSKIVNNVLFHVCLVVCSGRRRLFAGGGRQTTSQFSKSILVYVQNVDFDCLLFKFRVQKSHKHMVCFNFVFEGIRSLTF